MAFVYKSSGCLDQQRLKPWEAVVNAKPRILSDCQYSSQPNSCKDSMHLMANGSFYGSSPRCSKVDHYVLQMFFVYFLDTEFLASFKRNYQNFSTR